MDFTLPPEWTRLREQVREFVRTTVKPQAPEREQLAPPLSRFPWDWVEELSRMGVRTLALPREHGGLGAGALACCLIGEELGAGDLGLAVAMDQTWKLTPLLADGATSEPRRRLLEEFRDNPRFLMGSGSSEPAAGSDQSLPFNQPGAGARATATLEDGHWVVDGEKAPISNGGVARLYILMARSVPGTGGGDGLTGFYVPSDAPGFSVAHVYDKSGQRLNMNALLQLERCRLPPELVLGEPHQAGATMGRVLKNRGFPQAAAGVLGVARAAYEDALAFARSRVQGGSPIIQHANVAMMLAEMNASLEAARTLIWRAAWECDQPHANDGRLQLHSKVFASEVAFKVATQAMRIFGRWATLKGEVPVDKYLRDASSFLHSDGQNEVLLLKASRVLG
jgi:alkylation response protein AidB-like acyl-CoA dehydrogenase